MTPEELRTIRLTLGLTQAELAERLGISPGFIGEMERGEKSIELRTNYAVRYMSYRRCTSFSKRVTKRVSDIEWITDADDNIYADFDGFKVLIRPETKHRWSISAEHKCGYSIPWPKWEDDVGSAKASAILNVQFGLLDIYENQRGF